MAQGFVFVTHFGPAVGEEEIVGWMDGVGIDSAEMGGGDEEQVYDGIACVQEAH